MLWFAYNPARRSWAEVQETFAEWLLLRMSGECADELEGWQLVCLEPERELLPSLT